MVEVGDEREIMRFYESMSALTGWYTSKSAYFILIFFLYFKKSYSFYFDFMGNIPIHVAWT